MLLELAKDLEIYVAKRFLRVTKSNCSLDDIKLGTAPDLIQMEFETIPGKTRYLLLYETHRGLGGDFGRFELMKDDRFK